MADKTCVVNGGAWAAGATWGGSAPGVGDRAIIPDGTHIPLAPAAPTTIHDITINVATLDAGTNLTVSNTVLVYGGANLTIAAQTGSAATTTIGSVSDAGTLTVVGSIAGPVVWISGCTGTVTAADFLGNVTVNASTGQLASGIMHATLTLPGGHGSVLTWSNNVGWATGSTLAFTGSLPGECCGYGYDDSAPTNITAAGALILGTVLDGMAIAGTITVGGSCLAFAALGRTLDLTGATITGPNTAGAFFASIGVTGSPTVSGFEPLYKVGAAGLTRDSFGSSGILVIPLAADTRSGVQFGDPDEQVTGTLDPSGGEGRARGGMGVGL